jgi:hypothetical protein
MRNRSVILRQLVKENLDPKIAYVLGKNGKLVPKDTKEVKAAEALVSVPKENNEFILPEGAKSIPESLSDNIEISNEPIEEKVAVKKKTTVKKKSKVEATAE